MRPLAALLGAIAVLALLVPLVGVAALSIQLHELGLPTGTTVTDAVPAKAWVGEGARLIAVPGLAAIAAAALLLAFLWARHPSSLRLAVPIAAIAVALGPPTLALVRQLADPEMQLAVALLSGKDELIAGFLIAETSERAYMVAVPSGNPGDAFDGSPLTRVVAVRQQGIARVATRGRVSVASGASERAAAIASAAIERTSVRGVAEQELGRAFAPLVHLHRRERWLPISARDFIAASTLRFAHDEFCPDATVAVGKARPSLLRDVGVELRPEYLGDAGSAYRRHETTPDCRRETWRREVRSTDHTRPQDARRLAGLGIKEGFYLDLKDSKRPGAEIGRRGPQAVVRGVPVYVERTGAPGGSEILLTYWFLHAMTTRHEGDWQRVAVLVRRRRDDTYRPVLVRYHYYDELYREVPWADARRVTDLGSRATDATHPVVFSAYGTHESYWRPGRFAFALRREAPASWRVSDRTEACRACPQWRTWRSVRELREQPWHGFGGGWGEAPGGGNTFDTGPLGPSKYKPSGNGRVTADGIRRAGALTRRVTADVEELMHASGTN